MKNCKKLEFVATVLASIGAINWGLIGILKFNLVSWIAGLVSLPILETIVYILVGVSGVLVLIKSFMNCDSCNIK